MLRSVNLGFERSIFPKKNIGLARAALKIFAAQPEGMAIGPSRADNWEQLLRVSRDLNRWHGTHALHGTVPRRQIFDAEPCRIGYLG